MDTLLINSEVVSLLSEVAGQDLQPQDVTPTVLFLSALITVLSGVIAIDGIVAPEEEERLHILLNSIVPPESAITELSEQLLKGIEYQQTYLQPGQMMMLVAPLTLSQKMMLIGLGYEMASADGSIDSREQMYLQAIAQRLNIPSDHVQILETAFTREGQQEPQSLQEVAALLAPKQFRRFDPVFEDIARSILVALPTDPRDEALIEFADPVSDMPVSGVPG